jgi:hypothetical protein
MGGLTLPRDPVTRVMPMHCDVCEVSEELGLLAVAMYELNEAGERMGRVRSPPSFAGCVGSAALFSPRRSLLERRILQ